MALILVSVSALAACKRKPSDVQPAPSASATTASAPCPDGRSADPPQAEFRPAVEAFKAQNYAASQAQLDTLIAKYPNSATLQVWRGDAALFDKKAEYKEAAVNALVHYRRADELQQKGCKLPEVEDYYLRFDTALSALRTGDADTAIRELEISKRTWSDSAELHYNLARSYCMKSVAEACYQNFEQALIIAESLRRPKFLRSHYSVDDWIRRSKTQSEFPLLRRDKRYAPLVRKYGSS